jgi:hypothetical protein
MILPIILLLGAAVATAVVLLTGEVVPPVHEPEMPVTPGKTGWPKVDAILHLLRQAALESGIPLGLLVGWIAKESGGKIGEVTPKYNERGYFQLMPNESKKLGLDHERLSTDVMYSITAGLLLIGRYMKETDVLGVAPRGTRFYWLLVKLGHTMGSGATKKIVAAAKAAGQAGSWEALERYALDHNTEILHETKHAPAKWFPLIEEIYRVGAPFGFGSDAGTSVVGAAVAGTGYTDIPDPLALIQKKRWW